MRITSEVEIVNRLLPAHNLKKASRKSRAQVSVGRSGPISCKNAALYFMICTAKDRNGKKYLIKGNIGQIFAKFLSEGKATIRFKEPEEDVCISKADPLQLKSLLSVLKKAAQGDDLANVTLSSLHPLSTSSAEKLQSKMTILSRKDYPLTTTFPSSLQHLQVSNCGMKRLDSRILQLRNLEMLDLSDNLISALPNDSGRWSALSELRLSRNQMTVLPPLFWQSCLKDTLTVLDVSDNKLQVLPNQLCHLKGLVQLRADNNSLQGLPVTIGALVRLRILTASNNSITFLPAGITHLHLESMDLFGNPLRLPDQDTLVSSHLEFPSLAETTARAIKSKRIPYSEEDLLPHLVKYLDNARLCWCGQFCFQSSARFLTKCDLHKISQTVTAWNTTGCTFVPVEAYLCSARCLDKFQKNPVAYWRK